MEQEAPDAEALRRRLYRPGAGPSDLAVYLHATEEERSAAASPEGESTAEPSSSRTPIRPFVVGGAVVAAAALFGGVLLTSTPAAPAATSVAAVPSAAVTPGPDGSRVTFSQAQILDGGPATHAEGSATQEGSQLYRYVVTTGDTVPAIADRFGICEADVTDALPYGADPAELSAGQGLELSRSESNEC